MTAGASWTITASPTTVGLSAGHPSTVSFTVTNNAAAPAQRRGTIAVLPDQGTDVTARATRAAG
ncbi:hypothetical protein [Kitasatospora sp. NPDC087314]|uniref:hypothetical protein n=1 Tax=Kitasatospora sp. NPDC087314 TaxID=3364068 RepID=UPI00382B24FB